MKRPLPVLGWREWISLPDLGIDRIKAKVDTGARTSALHAFDIRPFKRGGRSMVRFKVHPVQKDARTVVECEAAVVDQRKVRSSSGQESLRFVISTVMEVGGVRRTVEITLSRRDSMGFRMLLGRRSIKKKFLVDPAGSFLTSRP
ncbi:MAG: RimK/LysX family protein [Gemmatimonadota bacterium]|nr:RimK/LysX family protein [Gemmatimonadota bacterium]MDH5758430.1 RimK/LysX family protein [Gemmatimonadota bacterium]